MLANITFVYPRLELARAAVGAAPEPRVRWVMDVVDGYVDELAARAAQVRLERHAEHADAGAELALVAAGGAAQLNEDAHRGPR
jgi:hypothetical protein